MQPGQKKIFSLLVIIPLFLVSCSVKQSGFTRIGQSLTNASIYINNDTLSEESGVLTAEIKTIPASSMDNIIAEKPSYHILRDIQNREFGDYAFTKALWQVNWMDETYRIVRFSINYKDAKQPLTINYQNAEWERAINGSAAEMVIEYLCR
ncbi:MAG: hypothetical protein JXR79_01175 [Nitrospirae bacterium]|nr:hypothetical protein [Nitrospirota bacterium]